MFVWLQEDQEYSGHRQSWGQEFQCHQDSASTLWSLGGLPWDPSSLAGPSCTRIGAVTRKTRLARGLRRYSPKQKELILEGGKGGVETNYRFLLRDVMELFSSVILDIQAIDSISFILSNRCLNWLNVQPIIFGNFWRLSKYDFQPWKQLYFKHQRDFYLSSVIQTWVVKSWLRIHLRASTAKPFTVWNFKKSFYKEHCSMWARPKPNGENILENEKLNPFMIIPL